MQEEKKRKVKLRLSRNSTQTSTVYKIFNKQEKKREQKTIDSCCCWAVQQQKRLDYYISWTILQARAWWFLPTPQFRWPTYHHFILQYMCVCISRSWDDIPIEKEPVACAPKRKSTNKKKSINNFGCCALTHQQQQTDDFKNTKKKGFPFPGAEVKLFIRK